jgi:hypothetical protein
MVIYGFLLFPGRTNNFFSQRKFSFDYFPDCKCDICGLFEIALNILLSDLTDLEKVRVKSKVKSQGLTLRKVRA